MSPVPQSLEKDQKDENCQHTPEPDCLVTIFRIFHIKSLHPCHEVSYFQHGHNMHTWPAYKNHHNNNKRRENKTQKTNAIKLIHVESKQLDACITSSLQYALWLHKISIGQFMINFYGFPNELLTTSTMLISGYGSPSTGQSIL